MNFLNYIKSKIKCRSTYFLAGTAVLELIALILYLNFGVSVFIPTLSDAVIAVIICGVITPFIVAVSPLKIAYTVVYTFDLLSCFMFLASQASFIANVFVAIDGSGFSFAFIAIVVCTVLASILGIIAMTSVKEPFDKTSGKARTQEIEK